VGTAFQLEFPASGARTPTPVETPVSTMREAGRKTIHV